MISKVEGKYVRPRPPQRRGEFMGGYFDPEIVRKVNNEVYAVKGQTRTQVMEELMREALEAREATRNE